MLGAVLIAVFMIGLPAPSGASDDMRAALTETYRNLADAIIAVKETENALVATMLMFHYESAKMHLELALSGPKDARKEHLETAAGEITYLANEGDREVQAIIQTMLKAGHHHHTDGFTREDYMYIDSTEKKTLLALAGKVARAADDAEIQGALDELTRLYQSAVEPD
jgi:hypothetical protein